MPRDAFPSTSVATLTERVAVIGLGYVGLPVAVAFARVAERAVGYDLRPERIAALAQGRDETGEIGAEALMSAPLGLSHDPAALAGATIYVLTVPTPIDAARRPDLKPLIAACETVGPHLTKDAIVVVESTVFPGATEEICGPALERASGLRAGRDFFLAYSPERINPGDREHRLESIVKVVSAQTPEALERVARAYGAIVPAGVHRAASIRIAEAAKVIENTQRDVNIALMNELAMIFHRLGLPTREVLEAAGTKWNFLRFTPGFVGGHCIGVDPYYLTAKAEEAGHHPEVILSGRRINDAMGRYVAQQTVRLLVKAGISCREARVAVLGLSFKENVPDLRNSRVADLVTELRALGASPMIHDPMCDPREAEAAHGLAPSALEALTGLDCLILAVPHGAYLADPDATAGRVRAGGVLVDVKSALRLRDPRPDLTVWNL